VRAAWGLHGGCKLGLRSPHRDGRTLCETVARSSRGIMPASMPSTSRSVRVSSCSCAARGGEAEGELRVSTVRCQRGRG
jgi:hypothetical protein